MKNECSPGSDTEYNMNSGTVYNFRGEERENLI